MKLKNQNLNPLMGKMANKVAEGGKESSAKPKEQNGKKQHKLKFQN